MEENALVRFTGDASDLAAVVQSLADAIASLSENFTQLSETATASLSSISDAVTGVVTELTGITDAAQSVGESITTLATDSTAALGQVGTAAQAAADATSQVTAATVDATGATTDSAIALAALGANAGAASEEQDALGVSTESATANAKGFAAAAESVGVGLDEAGSYANITGYQMLLLAGIMAQVARSFIDLGVQAQDQLSIVAALTGSSAAQMGQYTSELISLAESLGMPLAEAAQGLYYVVSAGYQGANAFPVLTVAMQDAIASGSDFQQVTDALTSAMRSYGASADDAGHYSDMMIQAVTYGKQTFQEFSTEIAVAAETGKNAGFSFDQVAAAESSLTEFGFHAQQAVRDLDVVMRTIGGTSAPKVEAAFKAAGVAFDSSSYYAGNFYQRLMYIYNGLKTNSTELTAAMGGVYGYQAGISIASDKTGTYAAILAKMQGQTNATTNAFNTSEQRLSAGAQHLGAGLSVLAYQMVQLATPILGPVLLALAKAFDALANGVAQHSAVLIPILVGLAAVFGGVIVAALSLLIGMLGAAIAPFLPLIVIIATIAANIAGFVMMVQRAIASHKELAKQFQELVAAIQPFLQVVGGALKNVLGALIGLIGKIGQAWTDHFASGLERVMPLAIGFAKWLSSVALAAQANFLPTMQRIGGFLGTLAGHIGGVAGAIAGFLGNLGGGALGALGGAFHAVAGAIGAVLGFLGRFLGMASQGAGIVQGGIGGAIHWLATELGNLWQAVQPVVHAIQDALAPAADALGTTFNTQLKPAFAGIQNIGQMLGQMFQGLWNIIQSFLNMGLVVTMIRGFGIDFHLLGVGVQWAMGHLGQILGLVGKFLQWTFIGILLRGIKLAFHDMGVAIQILLPILRDIGSFLAAVFGPGLHLIANILGVILPPTLRGFGIIAGMIFQELKVGAAGAIGLIVGILNGFIHALGMVLAGIIQFVGGAIRFFVGWVQFIVALISGFVTILSDIFTGHFNKLGKDIQAIWTNIKNALANIVGGAMSMMQGLITGTFGAVIKFAQGFMGGFLGVFGNLYHQITGQTLPNLVNGIKNGFAALPGDLLRIGADIIQHLINGILSKVGAVGNAISNVVGKIANVFPHSPPKEGPLMDLEQYGPRMMQMIAQGITSNVSLVQNAAKQAAQAAHTGLTGAGGPGGNAALTALGGQSSAQTALLSSILGQLRAGSAAGNSPQPAGDSTIDSRAAMGVMQQFGAVNFYGISQIQTAYQALTRMAGQAQENAQRGAVAGLPFS